MYEQNVQCLAYTPLCMQRPPHYIPDFRLGVLELNENEARFTQIKNIFHSHRVTCISLNVRIEQSTL
jgi:hypothetical protein